MWSRIVSVFSRNRRTARREPSSDEPLPIERKEVLTPVPNHDGVKDTNAESTHSLGNSQAADRSALQAQQPAPTVFVQSKNKEVSGWAAARNRPLVYAHKLRLDSQTAANLMPDVTESHSDGQDHLQADETSSPSVAKASTNAVASDDLEATAPTLEEQPTGLTTTTDVIPPFGDVALSINNSPTQADSAARFTMLRAVANQLRVMPVTCVYLVIAGSPVEARKLVPVIRALRARSVSSGEVSVCAAGEFPEMTRDVLNLFSVTVDLELSFSAQNQNLEQIRARMITGFGKVFLELKPQWLIVQGDGVTAAMASIAAYYANIHVAHIDDGVPPRDLDRSDESNPEVLHRLIAGLFASVHFAETPLNKEGLVHTGVPEESILITGNSDIDLMHEACTRLGLPIGASSIRSSGVIHVLVIAEMPHTLGKGIHELCQAIRALAMSVPGLYQFVWPVQAEQSTTHLVGELLDRVPGVLLTGPASYDQFLRYLSECDLVLTDVEDVQEEAPSFGKAVLLMSSSVERPEALRAGITNLTGTDAASIQAGVRALARKLSVRHGSITNPYGDGKAAVRILDFFEGRHVLEFGRTAIPRHIATPPAPATRLLASSN